MSLCVLDTDMLSLYRRGITALRGIPSPPPAAEWERQGVIPGATRPWPLLGLS